MRNSRHLLLLTITSCALIFNLSAEEKTRIDTISIIGSQELRELTPGSAHLLTESELEKHNYTDVNRVLRQVPGVYIREEEGYGLRPNIGIRGTGSERSGRITLMEDGVLIAPAPYAAPSAYYFPTTGRINQFEVLKGASAIKYGPYTVGGAVNLISTPIPKAYQGEVNVEYGTENTFRTHGFYGGSSKHAGFLVETHQFGSDGFKDIDSSGGDSGFAKEDYMVKLRVNSDPAQGSYHQLDLKLAYANEDSNQSYLGLTDDDFSHDAKRRYLPSSLDNFDGEHNQLQLSYYFEFNEHIDFKATYYYNDFKRNWSKTEGLDLDGSINASDFKSTSWSSVIDTINRQGALSPDYQAVLDGADTADGSIRIRDNNREYYSRGIDLVTGLHFATGNVQHDVEIGMRYHEDEEDRLQRNSTFHQEDNDLVLDDKGEWGNAGDREEVARAVALYLQDAIRWNQWTFVPGLRYENIDKSRLSTDRHNRVDVWAPGLGVTYAVNNNWTVLTGIHRGFTPPSSDASESEEKSNNYEVGVRFSDPQFQAELIGFYNDYENLLGVCTASSGSNCEVGDVFSGNGVKAYGLEASLGYQHQWKAMVFPIRVNYTYTRATFEESFDSDFFGEVKQGDDLTYTPTHQFNVSIGVENQLEKPGGWAGYLTTNYVDEMCTRARCDRFEQTDDSLTFDLSGHYQLTKSVQLYGGIDNVFDREDIIARQPYGARVNKPRTALLGVKIAL